MKFRKLTNKEKEELSELYEKALIFALGMLTVMIVLSIYKLVTL